MEKRREPLVVYKNQYWVSEIADMYFGHQLGYTSYTYTKEEHYSKGYDLVVMNKQLVPYYVLTYASPDPEFVPMPIMENDHESRIVNTESDFVFWWHIGTDKVSIISTPSLLNNFVDTDNYEDVGNILCQWVDTKDDIWNGSFNQFTLSPHLKEKANKIYDFRVSRLPLEDREVAQPLELARV
ncbi:MAG: hypothetical protein VW522_09920 [Candidatus Neomarinimicrobiota bacterium]